MEEMAESLAASSKGLLVVADTGPAAQSLSITTAT